MPELLFISMFSAIAGAQYEAAITAGVFLYRLYYWFVVFIPGFTIALFVLGWNLLGDAARDVFDPKTRRR